VLFQLADEGFILQCGGLLTADAQVAQYPAAQGPLILGIW
jgi:hypothetical protein